MGMIPNVVAFKSSPPETLQPSNVEQESLQAEHAVIDASVRRDRKALYRLLSEEVC
jgi:hypothetical protein